MKKNYNNWMKYIHSNLDNTASKELKFGEVGKRTSKLIQDEIEYLKQLDKSISNRVRASYKSSR